MSRQEIHCWSTRSNLTEIMVMFQTTPPHEHQPPVSELVTSTFLASNAGLLTKILITQALVFFGWMIFRANSPGDLLICMQKILFFDFQFSTFTRLAVLGGAGLILLAFVVMTNKRLAEFAKTAAVYDYLSFCARLRPFYWTLYIAVLGFAILLLSPPETPEFIYFAF